MCQCEQGRELVELSDMPLVTAQSQQFLDPAELLLKMVPHMQYMFGPSGTPEYIHISCMQRTFSTQMLYLKQKLEFRFLKFSYYF